MMALPLADLQAEVIACRKCPRLVRFRERIALEKVRRFRDCTYWGQPVPGFGDPQARMVLVGLAPAAHGANRTGRMFTGDRSGDFLYAALHRLGLASQPRSVARDDGLALRDVWITAAVRCAPPANDPSRSEKARCLHYLEREIGLLTRTRVIVALGAVAWDAVLRLAGTRDRFCHGAEIELPGGRMLLGSYHPSQQNTFTGRLTPAMLDGVLERARDLAATPTATGTVRAPKPPRASGTPRRLQSVRPERGPVV